MSRKILLFSILFLFNLINFTYLYSQDDKIRAGISGRLYSQNGGYFDYGDPNKVNIEVNVWGYVKFPGKYLIPKGTTMLDLLSYSGGPTENATPDLIRLFRPKNDSLSIPKDEIYTFDYNDLIWEKELKNIKVRQNVTLLPGDILVVTGEDRLFFRDNLYLILSILTSAISLGILINSIANK